MIRARAAVVAGLLTLAGSVADAAPMVSLTPLAGRTSDAVILRDQAAIESLAQRLSALGGSDAWRVARAQALLRAARAEYGQNDRTGFDVAAFAASRELVELVESGVAPAGPADAASPHALAGSVLGAEPTWNRLRAIAAAEGAGCALELLAQAEVELQWAGNEQLDQGDCDTSPHVAAAERLLRLARERAELCRKPAAVAVQREIAPAAPSKLPVSEPVPSVASPSAEELRIPRNVHFAVNRFDLSPTSDQVIRGIAQLLFRYPSITVRLEGHTDSRASVAYNLKLSKNRVGSVRARLIGHGVEAARISTAWKGKSELRAKEDTRTGLARNRRVEMVFVDTEGRDIQTEEQEEDLQIEGHRP